MNTKKPPPQIITEYKQVALVCPDAMRLVQPRWQKIVFVVATSEDGRKIIGIEENYYKNLAVNTQLALKAIRDRNIVMDYYKQCINEHNKKVDEGGGAG